MTVYPHRSDLPEVPPVDAVFVGAVEWCWGGSGGDRRDEYWLSRSAAGEWLLWISGEDAEGDASHIIYALSDAPSATPETAAADLLVEAWRAEGHARFSFVTAAGLLDEAALIRLADRVWE